MSSSHQRATAALIGFSLVVAAWWVFVGPGRAPEDPVSGDATVGWVVTHIVDGDTLDVTRDGVTERVRVIGIDTPERGECGYREATDALATLVDGRAVTLVEGATTDRDAYDRLLRYVEVDGQDVGLEQITSGYAIAHYDSRTGQPHPREDEYRAADDAAQDFCAAG